jgi:RimJ/RimL family protein N-acetyltransferase
MDVIAETERLILRPIEPEADLGAYAALNADPQVARYLGSGVPRSLEQTRDEISRVTGRYVSRGYGLWATVRKSDGAFLGRCGLLDWTIDGRDEVEVAYALLREHWGHGYATEAAVAVREWAFAYLDVDRLVSLVVPENEASKNVARKNGMRLRGTTSLHGLTVEVYEIERAAGG